MNSGKLIYREEALSEQWHFINVVRDGTIIGRIAKDPKKGAYRFFPGEENTLVFQYERKELSELKRLIETAPWESAG